MSRRTDAKTILKEAGLLGGLPAARLEELAKDCAIKALPKRSLLFHEGQKGRDLFLLVEGTLQLSKGSEEGREIVVKTIEAGDIFADAILFGSDRYPVSAVALKKSVVCAIPKRSFLRLLKEEAFRNEFMASLTRRLEYLTDRILYLTSYDVEARFFKFLRDRYGEREAYDVSLSKKAVAAEIGTTPETLSRLIDRLSRDGTVLWSARNLRLRPGFWST